MISSTIFRDEENIHEELLRFVSNNPDIMDLIGMLHPLNGMTMASE